MPRPARFAVPAPCPRRRDRIEVSSVSAISSPRPRSNEGRPHPLGVACALMRLGLEESALEVRHLAADRVVEDDVTAAAAATVAAEEPVVVGPAEIRVL